MLTLAASWGMPYCASGVGLPRDLFFLQEELLPCLQASVLQLLD